jgi:hypothetical protein
MIDPQNILDAIKDDAPISRIVIRISKQGERYPSGWPQRLS